MIAEVVVNYNQKQVDKLFDYEIPKELLPDIKTGSRVIVPFGVSDKHKEAFVMSVKNKSSAKKIKSILRYEDDVFSEDTAELIFWMRDKYMCSYLSIIKAIIPGGISIKPEEWILLLKEDDDSEIAKKLLENGGAMEINSLYEAFPKNITKSIKKLLDAKALKREYKDREHIKNKTVRVASINCEAEEIEQIYAFLKKQRATVQLKMFEILTVNERVSLADLVQFSGGNYGAIASLEKKGYIITYDIAVDRNPISKKIEKNTVIPTLNEEQKNVFEKILRYIEMEKYKGFLLHGVTGSGKTEVYMRSIEECINKGKNAIMLVPEISLTPQMVIRFVSRFGDKVAVFHSGLSMGERYDEWKKMRDGRVSIVIGARSAVFAPFKNIGIIIVDEEHEGTYKSDMLPRYNAKEVAKFRAMQHGAVLLLASATPEVSDYYHALLKEYELLEIKNRVNRRPLPDISIVDMREELKEGNRSVFSRKLLEEIKLNLENKEQSILFLNRRGYSTFVSCRNCGYVAKCPNCSISLTYHKYSDMLKCHYCGYAVRNYTVCPECDSKYIRYFGGGTQKVEEEIQKIFPGISTIRMDVDTTAKLNSHEKILDRFQKEKIDVLIGTQMVTKGLDFENVTLVGVISADVLLNIQDYRSEERTFDLIEQVTGRAGRSEKPGRAIIQGYSPENYALTLAKAHDYKSFYKYEIAIRKAMRYPPYSEMVSILFSGTGESQVMQGARFFARNIEALKNLPQQVQVLGPAPAALFKINNKYRWRILIKCDDADKLTVVLADAKKNFNNNMNYKNVTVVIDKNPNNAY